MFSMIACWQKVTRVGCDMRCFLGGGEVGNFHCILHPVVCRFMQLDETVLFSIALTTVAHVFGFRLGYVVVLLVGCY